MDYTKIAEDLRKRGSEVSSSSVAAVLTVEFQLMLASLLALLALLRMFSDVVAAVVVIPLAVLSIRLHYSKTAFQENDDRFSTLLFYSIVSLVSVILLVGWRP